MQDKSTVPNGRGFARIGPKHIDYNATAPTR